jgi:mRNA interferase MazF
MKNPSKTFDTYDIVVVPFPFVDSTETKRRPALVLSSAMGFNNRSGACVMAMITTASHAPWPCDVEISDLEIAGLPVKSIIRMKLFTIDQRLILKRLGTLSKKDQKNLSTFLKAVLPL